MNIVIKGTKTIEEFKEVKAQMEKRALNNFEKHKNFFENWQEGEIVKVWYEDYKNKDVICIEYESGNWWHYNVKGEWF